MFPQKKKGGHEPKLLLLLLSSVASSFSLYCHLISFFKPPPKIMEWFGLERTFKVYLVQPGKKQGHLQLGQVGQPDLECVQGRGIYHSSGQPVPVVHWPHHKKEKKKKKSSLYLEDNSIVFLNYKFLQLLKLLRQHPLLVCYCHQSMGCA